MRIPPLTGLWRNADFVRLWAAETISSLGGQVSFLALPLTAVLTLRAGPGEMGLLMATASMSAVMVSLFAGAWVDRLPRRPIMVAASATAAVLTGSIPVAWWLGFLTMAHLYAYALVFGGLGALFRAASGAMLPSLLGREQLVEANGKLGASFSVSAIAGPTFGGPLVQLLTAPVAMVVDAASFTIQAVLVGSIRRQEAPSPDASDGRNIWREVGEGLGYVLGHPVIRAITRIDTILRLFMHMVGAIYVLYVVRSLGISPTTLGLISATGGAGWLAGSLTAGRLSRRFGIGPTAVSASVLLGVSPFLLPLATEDPSVGVPLLVAAAVIGAVGHMVVVVGLGSLRQAVTPSRLLGRVVSSGRFLSGISALIGPLIGGFLGDAIGLRATLWIAASGHLLIPLWVILSPLPGLHSLSELQAEEGRPPDLPATVRPSRAPDPAPAETRAER